MTTDEKMNRALGIIEASIHHVAETNHRRLCKVEQEVAADIHDVKEALRESNEGVIRNRDALLAEFRDLAADMRALSGRMDRLERRPNAEREQGDFIHARVPLNLWNDIKDCLRGRMFVSTGDDEDNDDEVIALLRRIDEWSL